MNRGIIGAVVALISVVADLFGIVGAIGVVLTIIGLVKDRKLRKSGEARTGRGWMIFALIAGGFMFIVRAFFTVFGILQALQVPL